MQRDFIWGQRVIPFAVGTHIAAQEKRGEKGKRMFSSVFFQFSFIPVHYLKKMSISIYEGNEDTIIEQKYEKKEENFTRTL